MVTAIEIEERIAELHKQGATSKEISKDVHKNYTFIGAVLKKQFPEEYPDTIMLTKETQALRAFNAKKSPVEVAVDLNLGTDETEKFYTNFCRLRGLFEFNRLYVEHKPRLRSFLYFYKQLAKRKVTSRKDYDDVLEIIDTNNALDEEIEDFDTNFLPMLPKDKGPSRVLIDKKIFRQDYRTEFPDVHVYTADELERAFTDR